MKLICTLFFQCCFGLLMSQTLQVTTLTEPFDASGGVKLGPDGMLYVGNFGDGLSNANGTQVWRVHPQTGERELFASGLSGASGNAFDSQGNFFQSNIAGNRISKITPDGTVSTFTTTGFSSPVGIAIDSRDNLYVCNCGNNTIRKVSPQGNSEAFAGGFLFRCPNGITIDHAGNLYVSNFNNTNNVIKITPDGVPSVFADIQGANNGHLAYFAPDSIFYVNSHGSSSIYRMTSEGTVTKIAGSGLRGNDDGEGLSATFSRPNGIAVSVTGDTLWVNSSIPTQDNPGSNFFPLNPSVVRMITNLKGLTTGAKQIAAPLFELSVFPQPARHWLQLQVKLTQPQKLDLKILDAMGREVKQLHLGRLLAGSHRQSVSLAGLTAGQYYLVIRGVKTSVTRPINVQE